MATTSSDDSDTSLGARVERLIALAQDGHTWAARELILQLATHLSNNPSDLAHCPALAEYFASAFHGYLTDQRGDSLDAALNVKRSKGQRKDALSQERHERALSFYQYVKALEVNLGIKKESILPRIAKTRYVGIDDSYALLPDEEFKGLITQADLTNRERRRDEEAIKKELDRLYAAGKKIASEIVDTR